MSVATSTAIGIAGAIGATGSIAGSAISSNASKSAAQTQAQASQNALNFNQQVYNTEKTNAQPYLNSGSSALSTLNSDLPSLTAGFDPTSAGLPSTFGYTGSDFTQDPGYQFALQQGNQAIQRSAAARGGDVSGGALKALDAYTVGMADQDYGNAYNRALGTYQQNYSNAYNTYETNQTNQFNRLQALSNQGLSAATLSNNAGQSAANSAGQYMIGEGNALAAGTVGSANAINSGLSGATGSLTNSALLNQLLSGNTNTMPADPISQVDYSTPASIVTDPFGSTLPTAPEFNSTYN